jgi:hypothetical protein
MESAGSVDTTSHRSQSHTEPIPAELPRKIIPSALSHDPEAEGKSIFGRKLS